MNRGDACQFWHNHTWWYGTFIGYAYDGYVRILDREGTIWERRPDDVRRVM